jgi:hypothetical protein
VGSVPWEQDEKNREQHDYYGDRDYQEVNHEGSKSKTIMFLLINVYPQVWRKEENGCVFCRFEFKVF